MEGEETCVCREEKKRGGGVEVIMKMIQRGTSRSQARAADLQTTGVHFGVLPKKKKSSTHCRFSNLFVFRNFMCLCVWNRELPEKSR